MIDRERAINILEAKNPKWDYEDLEDAELLERIVKDIKCSPENRLMNRCRGLECVPCWQRVLQI